MTLAINLSLCPNRCQGCHSPHLREAVGEVLDEDTLAVLLSSYGDAVTCVCFMGGDNDPAAVERLSAFVKRHTEGRLRTGWYSGKAGLPLDCDPANFDYIKLGPYIESYGGLDSSSTNQRFYKVEDGCMTDRTHLFRKGR